ncbi:MAG: hypothetical protein MI924_20515 [Chloroflexales bacterium]|nr:hypothetical protein [Chloroflexales bacterium]
MKRIMLVLVCCLLIPIGFVSPAAEAAMTREFYVDARETKSTKTGLYVAEGEQITVTIKGEACFRAKNGSTCPVNHDFGVRAYVDLNTGNNSPRYSMDPVSGESIRITAPKFGHIDVGIQDPNAFDNTGGFTFRITVSGDGGGGKEGNPNYTPRKPNSLATTHNAYARMRILGFDWGPERRILQTQFRLNLSEEPNYHTKMTATWIAYPQTTDGWVVDNREIQCSTYVENGANKAECYIAVIIRKEGNWEMNFTLLESDKGTPEVSVSRRQGNTYATFQWIYRAQLSTNRSYSIYKVGGGSSPIAVLSGK